MYFEGIHFVFCKYNSSLLNIYCCTLEVSVLYIDLLFYFERWISILCKANLVVSNNSFILMKEYKYFGSILLYFESIFLHFESKILYVESPICI